jgi:hypothetical protein
MRIFDQMTKLLKRSPAQHTRNLPIGTVIELKTSKGLTYAQYTHVYKEDKMQGFQVMRLIEGFFPSRPTDMARVIELPTNYNFVFLLKFSMKKKLCMNVGVFSVPQKDQVTPKFRSGINDPRDDHRVRGGWIIDGKKSFQVPLFTPDQLKLPMTSVLGIPVLTEYIEIGWRPEIDYSVVGESNYSLKDVRLKYLEKMGRATKNDSVEVEKGISHYFIFKSEKSAKSATVDLQALGLALKDPDAAENKQWLVVAKQVLIVGSDTKIDDKKLTEIAKKYDGIYDGSETYVGG